MANLPETTPPALLEVLPRLLVRDVDRALRYYRDACGFKIVNRFGEPPVFGIVRRDGCGLHFKIGEPRPRRSADEAWDAYCEVRGVDALHAELLGRGARVIRNPETMPYGMRELDVVDPDGYVICFAEDVGVP